MGDIKQIQALICFKANISEYMATIRDYTAILSERFVLIHPCTVSAWLL